MGREAGFSAPQLAKDASCFGRNDGLSGVEDRADNGKDKGELDQFFSWPVFQLSVKYKSWLGCGVGREAGFSATQLQKTRVASVEMTGSGVG